jgi:hypothetical protein
MGGMFIKIIVQQEKSVPSKSDGSLEYKKRGGMMNAVAGGTDVTAFNCGKKAHHG